MIAEADFVIRLRRVEARVEALDCRDLHKACERMRSALDALTGLAKPAFNANDSAVVADAVARLDAVERELCAAEHRDATEWSVSRFSCKRLTG